MHAVAFRNCFKAILSKCETEVEQGIFNENFIAQMGLGAEWRPSGSRGTAPGHWVRGRSSPEAEVFCLRTSNQVAKFACLGVCKPTSLSEVKVKRTMDISYVPHRDRLLNTKRFLKQGSHRPQTPPPVLPPGKLL